MFNNPEQIKLGIAPIGWSNDDLPELGGDITFEQCISDMAKAGFTGCEVGNKFPRNPKELHQALSPNQLQVASAWFSCHFTEPHHNTNVTEDFIAHRNFLHAMGAAVIVVCECGHGIQQQDKGLKAHKPYFDDAMWRLLLNGLESLAQLAHEKQMQIVYHPHMGTGVQSHDEIDTLMQKTDPDQISLLFDTGHLYFANANPLRLIEEHGKRIKHVHLKDIRENVLKKMYENDSNFLDAVKAGVFTVPGDGVIDFESILQALAKQNYQGWLIVEAEQDPKMADPLIYATMARKYLHDQLGF